MQFNSLKKQKGIAILMLMAVIVLAVLSYIVAEFTIDEISMKRQEKTILSLNKAKQALIDYAITHADIPGEEGEIGFLPCPDSVSAWGTEGNQDPQCGARYVASIGYLPWKSLNIPVPVDDTGTCLMYAVSGSYKISFSSYMLNEDSNGMFQIVDASSNIIQGAQPEDRIVAIVFAPGNVLPGQNRSFDSTSSCGEDYDNETAYLDSVGGIDNGTLSDLKDTIDQFIHATATSEDEAEPYNDRFVTITRDEIWSAILQRSDFITDITILTEALAVCLAEYADLSVRNQLPWPVAMDLNGNDYRDTTQYDDNSDAVTGYSGRFPYIVDDSNNDTEVILTDDVLFNTPMCSSLTLPVSGLNNIDLTDGEYRKLYENWKDHFFYVLSREYEPDLNVHTGCGDCISFDGTQYAGMVLFSGLRQAGQLRNAPPDTDTKNSINNYLENGNEIVFASATGMGVYTTLGNEIVFCLPDPPGPLGVVQCQ